MGGKKYYTVFVGRKPGVYSFWPACNEQVLRYQGNVYKGYETFEEAIAAFNEYNNMKKITQPTCSTGESRSLLPPPHYRR